MTALYIFLSCFSASLATSVFWRLWTQRASNQEVDQQVNDQIANGDFPVLNAPFHFTLVSPEAHPDHD